MEVIMWMEDDVLCRFTPAPKVSMDIALSKIPKGLDYKVVESSELPSEVLRDSWVVDGEKVTIDIEKAKFIAHKIRREKRESAMAENLVLISKDLMGIPLAESETATKAKSENAAYKKDIDDVMQVSIDNSRSESDLLSALKV